MAPRTQPLKIDRCIVHVDPRSDLILVFHKAQVPVRESVTVEPFDRLPDCIPMVKMKAPQSR